MYVFLASPFSQFCEGDEDIIIKDRWFFEEIIKNLKNNNIDYFCSQEREAWGEKYISPDESINEDVNGIKKCDLFIGIPGNPISGGVHVEIGWASMLNKKIILFLDKNTEYSPMILGLPSLFSCDLIYYDELLSMETVKLIVDEIKKEKECI